MTPRREKGGAMASDASVLIVDQFPRSLRRIIHARAALEGRVMREVIVELLEQALAAQTATKGGDRDQARTK